MKIIESGGQFNIYGGNSIMTYDELPANYYKVCFNENKGFWLELHPEMQLKENKIYGSHNEKADKVLNSFDMFNRNLGVMISGNKGLGKSLFARLLSRKAIEKGLPVIVVNFYAPSIMDYIDSIQQEVMVLFDEFDKTFEEKTNFNPQHEILNVLDGLGVGKKLFAFVCNDLSEISDYMLNRPGRIHYHFRFGYPTDEEMREYLKDKLEPQYHNQINDIVRFSHMVKINYDCLRAIAFELNNGYGFKESINDLNIIRSEDSRNYSKLEVRYKNGRNFVRVMDLNLFDQESSKNIWLSDGGPGAVGEILATLHNKDIHMVENEEYFATVDELKMSKFNSYIAQNDYEREETERYYLNPQNITMITLRNSKKQEENRKYF